MNQPDENVGRPKAVAITGPTACGKTAFAVRLARAFNGEIVSADSRQVYKGLDIGSGKDLAEYSAGGEPVPYHLIDVVEPGGEFNLSGYLKLASSALHGIARRGRLPLLAGGTPLYVDALLKGYKLPGGPSEAAFRDGLAAQDAGSIAEMLKKAGEDSTLGDCGEASNRARLMRRLELATDRHEGSGAPLKPFEADWLAIGIRFDRSEIHSRIERRLDSRLAEGMLDEVRLLHEAGTSWERLEWFGLEYRYVSMHLQGRMPFQEMRDSLLIKIRQFAKRQDSWFRKMEREGLQIHWFNPSSFEEASALLKSFLNGETLPPPGMRLSETFFGKSRH